MVCVGIQSASLTLRRRKSRRLRGSGRAERRRQDRCLRQRWLRLGRSGRGPSTSVAASQALRPGRGQRTSLPRHPHALVARHGVSRCSLRPSSSLATPALAGTRALQRLRARYRCATRLRGGLSAEALPGCEADLLDALGLATSNVGKSSSLPRTARASIVRARLGLERPRPAPRFVAPDDSFTPTSRYQSGGQAPASSGPRVPWRCCPPPVGGRARRRKPRCLEEPPARRSCGPCTG